MHLAGHAVAVNAGLYEREIAVNDDNNNNDNNNNNNDNNNNNNDNNNILIIIIMIIIIIIMITATTTIVIMMIIMILIIIIIIIAFKGAIRDFFYNLLTTLRKYVQVAPAQSCANRVQHKRLSRAMCRVTCQVARRYSSAIKFDRVEIACILSFILLTEPFNR